ncbi:hypothetical protein ACFL4T_12600 [candidate division KSB1 bacterium]
MLGRISCHGINVIASGASQSTTTKTNPNIPADYDPEKSGQAVASLLVPPMAGSTSGG